MTRLTAGTTNSEATIAIAPAIVGEAKCKTRFPPVIPMPVMMLAQTAAGVVPFQNSP